MGSHGGTHFITTPEPALLKKEAGTNALYCRIEHQASSLIGLCFVSMETGVAAGARELVSADDGLTVSFPGHLSLLLLATSTGTPTGAQQPPSELRHSYLTFNL